MTVVYAAVLVWAGSLNAGTGGGTEAQAVAGALPVAGAITVATGEVGEEIAAVAAETPAEAPLVTLAIAAGMVALAGVAYGVHALRARPPRLARNARLVVRHITTLH